MHPLANDCITLYSSPEPKYQRGEMGWAWQGKVFTSDDGRLLVCDDFSQPWYRGARTKVHFLNRDTGREITLADNPAQDNHVGRNYHIDPHPRFCCNDQYVVFTTSVRGEVDVALVPTEDLVRATT